MRKYSLCLEATVYKSDGNEKNEHKSQQAKATAFNSMPIIRTDILHHYQPVLGRGTRLSWLPDLMTSPPLGAEEARPIMKMNRQTVARIFDEEQLDVTGMIES